MSNIYGIFYNITNNQETYGEPLYLFDKYDDALSTANKLALIEDRSFTICEMNVYNEPVDIDVAELIAVRLKYNFDYDEFTVLSTENFDLDEASHKTNKYQRSGDDESVYLSRIMIPYNKNDGYDEVIEKAKTITREYLEKYRLEITAKSK